jgi:hypothetical protein
MRADGLMADEMVVFSSVYQSAFWLLRTQVVAGTLSYYYPE